MSVTIYDIAREAGVSYATVSRILNGGNVGKRKDSRARALKVLEIAKRAGYEPDSSAQSLRVGRTGNICYVLSDNVEEAWGNPYYAAYLKGIEVSCVRNGYGLLVNSYNHGCFKTFFMERGLGQRKFDGLVIAGYVTDEMASLLNQHRVPFVNTGHNFGRQEIIPSLYCGNFRLELLKYANLWGHKKVGFASPAYGKSWMEPQLKGKDEIESLRDMEVHNFFVDRQDSSAGPLIFKEWLDMDPLKRSTLLALSHQSAAFFLEELKANGLSCPEDVSLLCTGESFACQITSPPLSIFTYNVEKHGEIVADVLIEHLREGDPLLSQQIDVPFIIIERKSLKNI